MVAFLAARKERVELMLSERNQRVEFKSNSVCSSLRLNAKDTGGLWEWQRGATAAPSSLRDGHRTAAQPQGWNVLDFIPHIVRVWQRVL